jgi:hypothetical protein
MKKLALNKESIRVLVASDLAQVHGGEGRRYSSVLPPQNRPVSSVMPPNVAHRVSSVLPPNLRHPVSSVRPVAHKVSSALNVFKKR